MRIFALSDIHADYSENMEWVSGLSAVDFTDDVLLLAGDISHKLDLLKWTLELLRSKFARLFFVPGNHDLWVRGNGCADSIEKYRIIMATCAEMDVLTRPTQLGSSGGGPWVVPLASWYVKPEESAASLYVEKKGEDPRLKMWVDDRAVVWPALEDGVTAAAFFHALNRCDEVRPSDGPVISFSHFLPRRELMFPTPAELMAARIPLTDPQPRFNFSRVAGTAELDVQIRSIGAAIHVYGHQHRNRRRLIDGVAYMSHCLGYPRERSQGRIAFPDDGPALVWDSESKKAENSR